MVKPKDQQQLVVELVHLLSALGLSCGFAESCTGGLLSSWITQHPGVSHCFIGSVVCYSNAVKQELLQVSKSTIDHHGAVSALTAKEMREGVRRLLKVDVAAAITGIAGPSGGTLSKPVGLVFVAVSGPGFERTEELQLNGDRLAIQRQSCERALKWMIDGLQQS